MAGHQNETKRHFETRQLDKDLNDAAKAIGRVTPAESYFRAKANGRFMFVVLGLLVVLLCYLFGAFG